MEKVQFKIYNFIKIIFYFYLVQFFLVMVFFKSNPIREAIASLIYFSLTSIISYLILKNENKNDSNSLNMNDTHVLFYIRDKKHEYLWEHVDTTISFKFFNFLYVVKFFSSDLKTPYYFILFSPTKDSFLQIVENNAPKKHSLFVIANKFKDSRF